MDRSRAEEILTSSERTVAAGSGDLKASGFWSLVAAVKRDDALRREFAPRIAAVDQAAFARWALVKVPLGIGTAIMVLGTLAALVVIGIAYYVDEPWNGLLLLAGTGALLVTTHGLGHLAVGTASGIKFTSWFIGTLAQPQPGVKVDYESYLAAPARGRAQMHAAGALTTKAMPFLLLGAAWGMGAPAWAWVILIGVGVVTIVTDVLWSVKSSDWKKYRREMSYTVD